MPIDTRDKRASVIGLNGFGRVVLPNPDGAVDAGDRQQVVQTYRGIAAAPPGGTTIVSQFRQSFQAIFSRVFGRVN